MVRSVFIIAPVVLAMAAAGCRKPDTTTQGSAAKLTTQLLTGTKWVIMGEGGYEVQFTDKELKIVFNFQGYTCGIAGYTINGDELVLNKGKACPPEKDGYTMGEFEISAQKCRITNEGLYFRTAIDCPSLPMMGAGGTEKKSGETARLEDQTVIIVNQEGVTTAAARIRTQPAVTAAPLKYKIGNNSLEDPTGESDTLPKGRKVQVVARTKEKVQVQQWNNYWYYVSFREWTEYSGWVYGEFINLDNK
ncbi:MAG: hypothetical protein OHK0011_16800 [Turneriella sp.]